MLTTLRSKIFAGFAAVIAVNLVFTLWAVLQFSKIGDEANQVVVSRIENTRSYVNLNAILEQQTSLLLDGRNESSDRESMVRRFNELTTRFRNQVETTIDSVGNHDSGIALAYDRFVRYGQSLLLTPPTVSSVPLDSVLLAAASVRQSTLTTIQLGAAEFQSIRDGLRSNLLTTLLIVSLGTLFAGVLGLGGAAIYSRWAVGTIERLRQGVKGVSRGETVQKIHVTSLDELGDLAYEFNRMIEELRRYQSMNLETLLLEKRKAEAIVQSVGTPIVVVDRQLHLVLVNSAALRLFRKPPEERLEGQPLDRLTSEEILVRNFTELVENEKIESRSIIWYIEREGKQVFYSVQILPLESTGTVSGGIALFSDVTELKELDRLKSDFLARVSHEFRTPLSSILMSVDILHEGLLGTLNERQKDQLKRTKEDCRRLSRLIHDILEMARLDSAFSHDEMSPVNVVEIVRSAVEQHQTSADQKGITLTYTADRTELLFTSLEEHWRWIVNNLVSNALRYTGEKGFVRVEIERTAEMIELRVSDTGTGIPPDSIDRLFEPFFQVDRGGETTPGSVGLGLAMVKEIVERYHGTITVASELTIGTRFLVRIPYDPDSAENI